MVGCGVKRIVPAKKKRSLYPTMFKPPLTLTTWPVM
jgi:hypothetical protein